MTFNIIPAAQALPRQAETACPEASSLIRMHTYKRPDLSDTEIQFILEWIRPLGAERDNAGNYYLEVGSNPHGILWSSHLDTVHKEDGHQKLAVVGDMLRLTKKEKKRGTNCLGADDSVGVWVMREMIIA